jgi:hypothetical protein
VNDRRTAPRETAVCPLDILDAKGRLIGCLADVSSGGLRILRLANPEDVELGCLVLEIPRWLGLERTLELPGRFVWLRSGPYGMEAGFAFDKLSKGKTATLAALAEKLAEMSRELGMLVPDAHS